MGDTPLEQQRDGYVLTTDRGRIPVDQALALLHTTFWAGDMLRDTLERAMENAVCVAVLADGRLVAFARAITDLATYAYVCDVVVHPDHGNRGLAQWMMRALLTHPQLQGFRRFALITTTAKALYEKFGFTDSTGSTYMELKPGPRS
ncbi:MAG TPA: GNAT family N-acetyltransferase [Gemmatimonadaceae bacterium]|nr:GNAT family N-acetyltransferase [Gemmatimonadaceae bacterium]